MELDFRKKIIIVGFIVIILTVCAYLYYDYTNSNEEINFSIEQTNEIQTEEKESDTDKKKEEENTIIIHIAGTVKNPRNCKTKRKLKII